MMDLPPDELYVFVVDTDSYAGNFERELCGYLIGFNGYDNEDDYWVKRYRTENNVDEDEEPNEHVVSLYCEYGQLPYGLWQTPVWINDGNGNHCREDSPKAKKVKQKWPAYNSVAIFFDARPTDDEIKTLQKRAKKFVELRAKEGKEWQRERITIEGFRLLLRKTTEEEILKSKV